MNLEPGPYRATVRGVPDTFVMLTDSPYEDPWIVPAVTQRDKFLSRWCTNREVTDARPLTVLDLDTAPHIGGQGIALDPVAWLRATASLEGKNPRGGLVRWIADEIEKQSKPPRIPEPGLWGVVEASCTFNATKAAWLHDDTAPGAAMWSSLNGRVSWSSLIDPTLIRDGIEATP